MSGSLAGYNNNPLEGMDQSPPAPPQDLHPAGGAGFRPKLTMSSVGVGGGACRYRECLKNHAASVGGNVTDGCGEFMPSGDDGTLEALKCAACNCHRNFHRKERGGGGGGGEAGVMTVHHHHLQLPAPPITSPSSIYHRSGAWSAPPPPGPPPQPGRAAGYGSGAATDSSSEEMNFGGAYPAASAGGNNNNNKKRFRTKFSQGQKERMMEFAEKLGWRIPREDDTQLQTFCADVGVKRQVFKVWMHNNKNSAAKTTTKNPTTTIHHHHHHLSNNNNNHHHHHHHPHTHHHHDDDDDDRQEEEEEDEDRRRRGSHQTLPGINAGI